MAKLEREARRPVLGCAGVVDEHNSIGSTKVSSLETTQIMLCRGYVTT